LGVIKGALAVARGERQRGRAVGGTYASASTVPQSVPVKPVKHEHSPLL